MPSFLLKNDKRRSGFGPCIAVAIMMGPSLAYGSPACMTQSEARAKFPKAHLYWHGREHCWNDRAAIQFSRTCRSARAFLTTHTSGSARARTGVPCPARNDPPRIAGRHHTSGSARGFATTRTSGSARGFATTRTRGSAHVFPSTRIDDRQG